MTILSLVVYAKIFRMIFFAVLIFQVTEVSARKLAPSSAYSYLSVDNKLRFIMLPQNSSIKVGGKIYRQSGMYEANGSGRQLWPIGWYGRSFDLSVDGRILIRYGHDVPVAFYRDGKLIRSYPLSSFQPPDDNGGQSRLSINLTKKYYADRQLLLIRSGQNYTFVFGSETGDLVTVEKIQPLQVTVANVTTQQGKQYHVWNMKACHENPAADIYHDMDSSRYIAGEIQSFSPISSIKAFLGWQSEDHAKKYVLPIYSLVEMNRLDKNRFIVRSTYVEDMELVFSLPFAFCGVILNTGQSVSIDVVDIQSVSDLTIEQNAEYFSQHMKFNRIFDSEVTYSPWVQEKQGSDYKFLKQTELPLVKSTTINTPEPVLAEPDILGPMYCPGVTYPYLALTQLLQNISVTKKPNDPAIEVQLSPNYESNGKNKIQLNSLLMDVQNSNSGTKRLSSISGVKNSSVVRKRSYIIGDVFFLFRNDNDALSITAIVPVYRDLHWECGAAEYRYPIAMLSNLGTDGVRKVQEHIEKKSGGIKIRFSYVGVKNSNTAKRRSLDTIDSIVRESISITSIREEFFRKTVNPTAEVVIVFTVTPAGYVEKISLMPKSLDEKHPWLRRNLKAMHFGFQHVSPITVSLRLTLS